MEREGVGMVGVVLACSSCGGEKNNASLKGYKEANER